jgi:hypothetical protein
VLSGDVEVLDKCQRSYRLMPTALAAVPPKSSAVIPVNGS